ncbi:MAG: hypothetical protein ACT4OM_03910 [Actinomycetota bacterium]
MYRFRRSMLTMFLLIALAATAAPAGAQRVSGGGSNQLLDEVWLRSEPNLGLISKPADGTPGEEGVLDGDPWLATNSTQFVNIKQETIVRGSSRTVNGIQMSSSFVAPADTNVAIHFSAEAFVEGKGGTAPDTGRMFLRALVDGKPAAPSDVVFTVGPGKGARSFIFGTQVDKGVHTVEIQWKVDPPRKESIYTGRIRDASLMIRQGRTGSGHSSQATGNYEVNVAPSGANHSKNNNIWAPVPNMSDQVTVAAGSPLVASFSAESRSLGSARMALRAKVDGVPMLPADIVFAKGGWQSRSATFTIGGLAAGPHTVVFEWLADGAGSVEVGDRSMALAGFPHSAAKPSHPAKSMSGVQDAIKESKQIPGMNLAVWIPERGNGEVAAIFSAEIGAGGGAGAVGLAIDGQVHQSSVVELIEGEQTQNRSWVFDAKKLSSGLHDMSIWAFGADTLNITVGDRTLAVVGETGAIPDLAEAALLGPARFSKGDNLTGIEAVIGTRPVLQILWDAHRPGHDNDITPAELSTALDRTASFYKSNSGGRFWTTNAGVLGPYDAVQDEGTAYWNHPADTCQFGYDSGATHRRSEAVTLADPDVDFSQFDKNSDGTVGPDELAIVVVYKEVPKEGEGDLQFGQARTPLRAQDCPENEALVLDNVLLPDAVDWFVNRPEQAWIVLAHELAHQVLGLDDLYYSSPAPMAHRVHTRSLMGTLSDDSTPHLDPIHKLALGWLTPHTVLSSGNRAVVDGKLSETVDVLPRWNSTRRDEYLVLENRTENMGWNQYDDELGGNGMLVWHVAEDPLDNLTPPSGTEPAGFAKEDTQARRAIRLLRPFTQVSSSAAITSANEAGWHAGHYALVSGKCVSAPGIEGIVHNVQNVLAWADCSASPYSVRTWSELPAAPDPLDPDSTTMSYDVSVE